MARLTMQERFWLKVNIEESDKCWLWMAGKDRDGYGRFAISHNRQISASRMAYILTNGEIPDSIDVLHSCDNPPCCNPNHLFSGTNADNMKDKYDKGRQANGIQINTNKLTVAQVREIRSRYTRGKIKQSDLSKEYGVSQTTVSRIILHTIWKQLI